MQSGIDRRAESVGAVRFGECPGGAGGRQGEPGDRFYVVRSGEVERLRLAAELHDGPVQELAAIGYAVVPSDANFVLFGRFADRHALWQGLLDRGVLVRESGPEGWLRVSIGTREDMAAFRVALVEAAKVTR